VCARYDGLSPSYRAHTPQGGQSVQLLNVKLLVHHVISRL